MNILLLAQEYPPESAMGGVGTYMHSMAHAYAQLGHTVHVVSTAAPGQATYSYMQDRVHVHRIRRWKFEIPILRRIWHTFFPWTKHQIEYALGIRSELARIVREQHIEIIEGTELWAEGFFYSFTRQAPIMLKLHTPLFVLRSLNQMRETLDWKIVDRIDRTWTCRADHIVSASASLAQIVAAKYHLDAQKIPVVPVPVDTTRFPALAPAPNDSRTIMYIGQLEPRKGVLTIVEAMPQVLAEFSDARFVFVGGDRVFDGRSCRAMLDERLTQLNMTAHAEFTGRVPNGELGDYLARASVCLFPSQWENFAISCLEAMASARPVIASRAGGLAEMVVDGESGLLVTPGSADELANAIKEILRNPARAETLAQNARKRVEQNFSVEIIARQNLAQYSKVIETWKQKHGERSASAVESRMSQ